MMHATQGAGPLSLSRYFRAGLRPSVLLLACAALAGCGGNGTSNGNTSAEAQASNDTPATATPNNVPVTARGIPRRADGWWEIRRVNPDGSDVGKQFLCVGGGSEDRLTVFDQVAPFSECSKKEFKRTARGWSFDTQCSEVGVKVASKGTISGDFQQSYRADLSVEQSNTEPQIGSLLGKRVGECPTGVKGGAIANAAGRVIG